MSLTAKKDSKQGISYGSKDDKKKQKKKKSRVREWSDAAIFAVIAAPIIRTFFFEAYTIPSPSMEKTLLVHDFLYSEKYYWVQTNGNVFNPERLNDIGIDSFVQVDPSRSSYEIDLTPADSAALSLFSNVKSIRRYLSTGIDPTTFPQDTAHFKWNADYYGSIWIPKKGATVHLTMANIASYRRIIQIYEHNQFDIKNGVLYINNKPTDHYTFKMNYYWMMGDNRDNSEDSRFWGFMKTFYNSLV